jgi:hypothetical protein
MDRRLEINRLVVRRPSKPNAAVGEFRRGIVSGDVEF